MSEEERQGDEEPRPKFRTWARHTQWFCVGICIAVSSCLTSCREVIATKQAEQNIRFLVFIAAFFIVIASWALFAIAFIIHDSVWYLWIPGSISTLVYMFAFFNTLKFVAYNAADRRYGAVLADVPRVNAEMFYLWVIVINMIPMLVAFIIAFVDHHNGVAESASYACALQTFMIFVSNVVIMIPQGCLSHNWQADGVF